MESLERFLEKFRFMTRKVKGHYLVICAQVMTGWFPDDLAVLFEASLQEAYSLYVQRSWQVHWDSVLYFSINIFDHVFPSPNYSWIIPTSPYIQLCSFFLLSLKNKRTPRNTPPPKPHTHTQRHIKTNK